MNLSIRYPLTALALSLTVAQAPALAAEEPPPSRAAFAIDLTGGQTAALAEALRQNLAALLAAAQYTGGAGEGSAKAPRITSIDRIIEQLRQHKAVAYVVLAERDESKTGETAVKLGPVFVVPDVIKLTIHSNAEAKPGGEEPEVSVVPGKPGEPPRIKFQFDPSKYEQPQR